jgi:lipoyl(octanoyl) transferase
MPVAVHFQNWGIIDYQEAWDKQEVLFKEKTEQKLAARASNLSPSIPIAHHLVFCQHPHVFTLGKSGDANNLLLNEEELNKAEATYYPINRGGDITYHGPGQLVGYPILDLEQIFTDIHKYLRLLEESVIQMLAHYGIKGGRYEGYTGVWLEPDKPSARKICAMGVRCSRWVTMHGFALNVNTDLSYFKHIVPCGIDDKDVTSMERELGFKPNFEEVSEILKEKIAAQFDFTYL